MESPTRPSEGAAHAAGIANIAGIADVEVLRGPDADPSAPPALLVEVPHGADRRSHHDALCQRLKGPLPERLHAFTHVNTDVGAWQLGRRAAQVVLERDPGRAAVVLRCLVPRTLVDCNRLEEARDELASGGMTAGIAPYVKDPDDRALLLDIHRRYVAVAEAAYQAVCGAGGIALQPHTYAPVSVDLPGIDENIVRNLEAAYAPDQYPRWPVRPPIDLITRTQDGTVLAPPGAEERAVEAFTEAGFEVAVNQTYRMHPATLGHAWAARYPGQTFSLEVRRDLLVRAWRPFEEMEVDPTAVERAATPLAKLLHEWLSDRGK